MTSLDPTSAVTLSPDQQAAYHEIVVNRRSVFLTGDAGAGKTFLTNYALSALEAQGVSVHRSASTGIAASHIDGSTVYRMFGIVPTEKGPILRSRCPALVGEDEDAIFVIDEMSMLRVDVLDCINKRLQRWGDPWQPWGGYQVLFVGDWEQLPPVVKGKEIGSVRAAGCGEPHGFAFQHPEWTHVKSIVLTTAHRQSDDEVMFKRVLTDIRYGRVTQKMVTWMNTKFNRGPAPANVIRLCNTRKQVDRCNKVLMPEGETVTFKATSTGSYADDVTNRRYGDLPLPLSTTLTRGSRVMCKKNLTDTPIVNGDLGTLLEVSDAGCLVKFDRHGDVYISRTTVSRIEGMEDHVNTDGDVEQRPRISGSFTQMPLIAAHAITIHASQGLSLEAAEISMDRGSRFAPEGLMYVALSRIQSLSGVYISYPLELWMFNRSKVVARESLRIKKGA